MNIMTTDVYPVAAPRSPGEGETTRMTGQPDPEEGGGRIDGYPRRRHRRWLQRRKRKPWLKCLRCGQRLVPITVWEGWTRVRVGRAYSEGDTKFICPNCLSVRRFETRSL